MKPFTEMHEAAERASKFLKALANQDRLMILCHLAEGEKNVSELQELLGLRQPTMSQQLSRLREDHIVEAHRKGKEIYYGLCSDAAGQVIQILYETFCAPANAHRGAKKQTTGSRGQQKESHP